MPKMQNRVQETTTTGGTGTITLAGAVTGYITFAAGFTTGDVLFYTLDNGIGEWEIGIGTLVTTGTLSRTTVIASSNSGALVNFSSGTKRVFCSAPTRSLVPDQDSKSGYVLTTDGTNPSWTQTLNSVTIGNTTPAAGAFTTLSASSTVSGTGFSNYLASPPAIGGSSPAAGSFTTLTTSSTVTLNGGTANGVGYLNASKVLTTGTALTFNGTTVTAPQFYQTQNLASTYSTQVLENTASNGYSQLLFNVGVSGANGQASISYAPGVFFALGPVANDTTTPIVFRNNNATERMCIDSSGNLGLGVTPSAWGVGKSLIVGDANSGFLYGGGNEMILGSNAYFNSGWKYSASGYANLYWHINGQHQWHNAPSGTAGSAISFTQAMTLTAAGNLLVGCTSEPSSTVFGWSVVGPSGYRYIASSAADAGSRYHATFLNPNGMVGRIETSGTATAYITSSDYRLKENVKPIQNALSRVSLLKPSTYQWKSDGSEGEGFIAHELQEVVPQAVSGEKDGEEMQGVDYGKLTPLLAAAIQEIVARLEKLEAAR